jgi:uncharacterized membrane protein
MTEYPLVATRARLSTIHEPNLTASERTLSVAAGAVLLINGLRTGGFGGIAQACLGSYGLIRGVTGNCALKKAVAPTPFEEEFQEQRGWSTSEAVTRSITINKPQDEVLALIREPQNIARLIPWIDSVQSTDRNTSRWIANAPLGRKLEWNLTLAEVQADSLRWNTAPETRWEHDISVQFKQAPANRGTEVKVVIVGKPPLGTLGYALANALALFTDKALLNVLRSVKQQLETGEVSTNHMRQDKSSDLFHVDLKADESEGSGASQRPSVSSVKSGVALEGGNV